MLQENPSIEKLKCRLRDSIQSELGQVYGFDDRHESGIIFRRFDRLLQTIGSQTYLILMRRYYHLHGDNKTFRAYVRWRRDLQGIFDEGDHLWDDLVNCDINEPSYLAPYSGHLFHLKVDSVRKELLRKFKGTDNSFQADQEFASKFESNAYAFHIFRKK